MVWACGKNGWLPYGQKGVDGRSQWGTGTRETEVGWMDHGWCEGGLRQQRNDGGGCTTMHEWPERVESPGTYVIEWVTLPYLLGPAFFRTALTCSGGYHMERGRMGLHDVVGINRKKGKTTENQGSAVKYMC